MSDVPHIMIVEAPYYTAISESLRKGALRAIEAAGATWELFSVPGAFEIPAAIRFALRSRDFSTRGQRFDGYVALGCVIRGETSHYDYVCGESARGLTNLAVDHGTALGNGILTTENRDQAMKRAAVAQGNKGAVAAEACLALIGLARRFAGDA